MMKILVCLILIKIAIMWSVNSYAQSSAKPRQQTLNFEDELVEGATQKPELFFLLEKKNFNYKRLIKLRENFLPEMRETSEIVKRSGSGD